MGPSALLGVALRGERGLMEASAPIPLSNGAEHRTERGRFVGPLLLLEVGLCAGAIAGAGYLITERHTAMPGAYLARTPFSSWLVPGVLLASCVALPAGVVSFGTATRRRYAHAGHPLLGLTLMCWIVVQLAVLGPISLLQPAMFAWGLAILLLGVANYREHRRLVGRLTRADAPMRSTHLTGGKP